MADESGLRAGLNPFCDRCEERREEDADDGKHETVRGRVVVVATTNRQGGGESSSREGSVCERSCLAGHVQCGKGPKG